MNISTMQFEIHCIPDAMVCKSSLPYFLLASELGAECVRISTLDQLHSSLQCRRRREQEMNVLGHDDKRVQLKRPLTFVAVESFQEQSCVWLHDEEPHSLER